MRDIKFRIWDKVDYMTKPYALSEIANGYQNIQFTSDCPVMQYTGLKDKHDKEIYEGDVLQKTESMPMTGRKPQSLNIVGKIKKVIFHEGAFCLNTSLTSKRYRLSSVVIRYYGFEIIGNIYENPELLNLQNKNNDATTKA